MKKNKLAVLSLIILSILLLAAGNAVAYDSAYTHTDYAKSSPTPVIDGIYTDSSEWSASHSDTFGVNGLFRDEWVSASPNTCTFMLVETADNTNDAGDYWEMCYDSSSDTNNPPNNGLLPQWDDTRIVITGHGGSQTWKWYYGDGTQWVENISKPAATVFYFQETNATWGSVTSSPHYILEMLLHKQDISMINIPVVGRNFAMRVAYNDAHSGGYGLQAWPPTSDRNIPNSWGYVPYSSSATTPADPTPENLDGTVGIVVITLLSVAVIAGAVHLHKRQKITPISKSVAVQ
jgi:hypothetical protein